MLNSRKANALFVVFLIVMLAFAPLIGVAHVAFAEYNTEAQSQEITPVEVSDNEVETQDDEPPTYGGEQLSDWSYTDNDDNSVTLTAYEASPTDVIIPGELEGHQVKIASLDFWKSKTLSSIKIAEKNDKKVVFSGTSMREAFKDNSALKSADLSGLDTSNVFDMTYLFDNCRNLESVNLDGLNTSKVTNMFYMFNSCSKLKSIDVSMFDTANVERTDYMFAGLTIEDLDLSNFDLSISSTSFGMFEGSRSLKTLKFGKHFITNANQNSIRMFRYCSSLTELDLSDQDLSGLTYINYMFDGCTSLKTLNLGDFKGSKVTSMQFTFLNCTSLDFLDLSKFDTSNVENMQSMFGNCSSLTSLDLSNFETSSVTNMASMFNGCSSLRSLDLSSFDTSNVVNMADMFYGDSFLETLDLSSFNTSNVTDFSGMFSDCTALKNVNVSSFNTSSATKMNHMFHKCESLLELDLSNFDTSNVTNMKAMFAFCKSLKNINLSGFNTEKVTDFTYMFDRTESLFYLDISSFVINASIYKLGHMFLYAITEDGLSLTEETKAMAIIATDPTLKSLDNGGTLDCGYGLRPYRSTITYDSHGVILPTIRRDSSSNNIATFAGDSDNIKSISSEKIMYGSVAEFEEAQKRFTLTKDEVLENVSDPTRSGYNFKGWFTDETGKIPLGDTLILTGRDDSFVIYAGWNNPNLNIDTNGDGIPDINIDTDGDGVADINIDTDGDGIPDTNLDPSYSPNNNPNMSDNTSSDKQITDVLSASAVTSFPATGDNITVAIVIALTMLGIAFSVIGLVRTK